MTCQQHEADLVDLARGVLDGSDDADSVRRHADGCAACAVTLERERALTAGLRRVAASTEVPANDLAERRLLQAFAAAREASRPTVRRSTAFRWAALATAASVLFLLGLWGAVEWRVRSAAPGPVGAPAQAAAPPQAAPRPVEKLEFPVAVPTESAIRATRAGAPGVVRAAARRERPQEIDRLEGFIPLPAADGLPGFDSGMIVRVALPTASLPAFGLAITPEATDTVNADLLVGQDGQARAIRLVSLVGGSRREP